MPATLLLLAGACALLAPTPAGQVSSGPFMAIAHGVSVDAAPAADPDLTDGTIYHKAAGNPSLDPYPPQSADCTGAPFSLLPAHFGSDIHIDAVSLGFDWITATELGWFAPPPQLDWWAALTYVVSAETEGAPGHPIDLEVNGVAGDLFSFSFPGSNLPPGTSSHHRAQDSTEMGIWADSSDPFTHVLDAHDVFIGVCNAGPRFDAGFPPTVTLYFSVEGDWAGTAAAAAFWVRFAIPAAQRTGRTILATTWDGTAWGPVTVHLPEDALIDDPNDDVDALAYDSLQNFYLFSTENIAIDTLQFYSETTAGAKIHSGPFLYSDGTVVTPVSALMGLTGPGQRDDLKAICALDPSSPRVLASPIGEVPTEGLTSAAEPSPLLMSAFVGAPAGSFGPVWAAAAAASHRASGVVAAASAPGVTACPPRECATVFRVLDAASGEPIMTPVSRLVSTSWTSQWLVDTPPLLSGQTLRVEAAMLHLPSGAVLGWGVVDIDV